MHILSPGSWASISLCLHLSLGLGLALSFSQAAGAQESEGVDLFLSAAGGYTHIDPDAGSGTSKNGYHLLAMAFATYSQGAWVAQLGGGFFYNRVYSDGEKDFPVAQDSTETSGASSGTLMKQTKLRIETRAGAAELGLRRQLGLGLAAGLMVRSLFGSSLSFSQEKDTKASKFFVGPQLTFRGGFFPNWLDQSELYLATDLNVKNKRVYLLTAGFAVGTSLIKTPIEAPAKPAPEERYEEILADKVINFPSGSAALRGPALEFLKELGAYLQAHPENWQRIDIEGHTDKKGRLAYNMQLSQDRSATVKRILEEAGVPAGQITAQGFGPTRPLIDADTPEALAANRRVVMAFVVAGRAQRNLLSATIKDLRKKHFNE